MKHFKSPRKINAEGSSLADKLLACRELYGETQDLFCYRFGISRFTYARWERWGPPNTVAHRGYVKMKLRKLNAKKRASIAKHARLASEADRGHSG